MEVEVAAAEGGPDDTGIAVDNVDNVTSVMLENLYTSILHTRMHKQAN